MEKSEHILNELKLISPVMASAENTTPYQVPEGYFGGLTQNILAVVKAEGDTVFTTLEGNQKNPFEVPPLYFDHVSDQILNRIRALDASSPGEELEALSPLLLHIDKAPVFSKPTAYFEELSSDILAGVNAIDFVHHELETLPPALSTVSKGNVYSLPDHYFEHFPRQLLEKVKETRKPALLSGGFRKRIINYAVAALVMGAIAVGAWEFFLEKNESVASIDTNEMSLISNKEKISDDEIVNYLEFNSTMQTDITGNAVPDLKDVEVKELLADIPDEELRQYLEQNAASADLTIN